MIGTLPVGQKRTEVVIFQTDDRQIECSGGGAGILLVSYSQQLQMVKSCGPKTEVETFYVDRGSIYFQKDTS